MEQKKRTKTPGGIHILFMNNYNETAMWMSHIKILKAELIAGFNGKTDESEFKVNANDFS